MEIRIPSVSSLIEKRANSIALNCLSNNICKLFEKCFEETDHKYAIRYNKDSVKVAKMNLET